MEIEDDQNIISKSSQRFFKSNISCDYLLEILKIYSQYKRDINFFDFGANNIDNYIYINKNLPELNYYYYDQESYISVIEKIFKEYNFENFTIIKEVYLSNLNLDFAFFGSSLQYLKNFEDILKQFIKNKAEYIFISQTPFYNSPEFSHNLIMKQVNVAEQIFYLYFFNYDRFVQIFEKGDYKLIFSKSNTNTKFLNFKNFERTYHSINMLDILFKYISKK